MRLYLLTGDIFVKLRQRHSTIRTLMAWDSDTRIGITSSVTESKRIVRPGGTGLVAFELGRIFLKIQNKTVNFLESKVYTVERRPLLTGKRQIATAAFKLGTWHSDS